MIESKELKPENLDKIGILVIWECSDCSIHWSCHYEQPPHLSEPKVCPTSGNPCKWIINKDEYIKELITNCEKAWNKVG